MIGGVEATHTWLRPVLGNTPVPTATGGYVLGAHGAVAWPHATIDRITGLMSLADGDDVREPRVGEMGEYAYPSLRRGKTVTYEGLIRAKSPAGLRSATAAMRAAFADLSAEGVMRVQRATIPAGEADSEDTFDHFYRAKPIMLEIPEEQGRPHNNSLGFERPYALGLRMQPLYFDTAATTVVLDPFTGGTPTLINAELTPLGIDPVVITYTDAALSGSQISVAVTLVADGTDGPVFTTSLSPLDGSTVWWAENGSFTVDFTRRKVFYTGGTDVNLDVTARMVQPSAHWFTAADWMSNDSIKFSLGQAINPDLDGSLTLKTHVGYW